MKDRPLRLVSSNDAPTEPILMPLHRAKFCAVDRRGDWQGAMSYEFSVVSSKDRQYSHRFSEDSAFLNYSGYDLEVDRVRGEFWLNNDNYDEMPDLDMPHGYPTTFFARAEKLSLNEQAEHLVEIARRLWIRMQTAYIDGLSNGSIEIYARPGSPLSEFQRIMPDQWAWFTPKREDDDDLGGSIVRTAVGPNGEVLYNPHFLQRFLPPQASSTHQARPRRTRLFTQMLIGIINDQPTKPMSKQKIIELARAKFGADFTQSEILKCRDDAINRAVPNTWNKPGRRPKSSD